MAKFLKFWLPVIAWMGLIFYLSSIPDLKSNLPAIWDLILRKIAHILEFYILFLLFTRALDWPKKLRPRRTSLWLEKLFWDVIFSIIYAFSDEYHQKFVHERGCSLKDVGFDTIGVLFGYFVSGRTTK